MILKIPHTLRDFFIAEKYPALLPLTLIRLIFARFQPLCQKCKR